MKALALLLDGLNSIISYSIDVSKVSSKDKAKFTRILFITIATLLVILLLAISIVYPCYSYIKKKKREKKICDEETGHGGQQTSGLNNKSNVLKFIILGVFGLLKIASTELYFIGDNLENALTAYSDDCTKNSKCDERQIAKKISLVLLIIGITGFYLIPQIEKEVMQIFKIAQQNENSNSNRESDDNKIKNHCSIVLITMLGTIAETDALYTTITTYNACSVLIPLWIGFGLVLIGLILLFSLKIVSFIKINKNCDTKCGKLKSFGLIVFVIVSLIMSASYILGDNKEALDCHFKVENNCIMNIKGKNFGCAVSHLFFMVPPVILYFLIFLFSLFFLLCEVKKEYSSLQEETTPHHDPEVENSRKSISYGSNDWLKK